MRRWLDRVGFLGLSSGVFLYGFVQGHYALTLRLEFAFAVLVVVLVQAVVSSMLFSGFMFLSGLLFVGKITLFESRNTATAPDDGDVAAIVPVYEDAGILETSVESLLESTYDAVTVHVVCEPDDGASIRRARELADNQGVEILLNDRYPGSKAGAINYALEATNSDYVGVFDADESVHAGFVEHAVGLLDDHGVVQGRTVPRPTGLIESLAYYESVLLSYTARRFLYVLTGFRMAASRAVVARRSALEAVDGYDSDMLTEDFDFAYRCYTARLDVVETLQCPSTIEAAHSWTDWWGQRKRWMTGYAQVFHKLLGNLRPHRDYRSVTSLVICASTILGSLLMLSLLSKFAVLFVIGAGLFSLVPLSVIIGVTLTVRAIDYKRGHVKSLGWHWLIVPVIFPLYSLTAIKALLEYLVSWDGDWYSVSKGA